MERQLDETTKEKTRRSKEILPNLFLKKCKVRKVDFSGPEEFFDKTLLDYTAKTWEHWLGPLVPELPPFELVIDNFEQKLFDLFKYAK